MKEFFGSFAIPNAFGVTVNEIFVDFFEDTVATEMAIKINVPEADMGLLRGGAMTVLALLGRRKQRSSIWRDAARA